MNLTQFIEIMYAAAKDYSSAVSDAQCKYQETVVSAIHEFGGKALDVVSITIPDSEDVDEANGFRNDKPKGRRSY